MPTEPRSILVVLPTWVGDTVMATPALRALRNRYPHAHTTFLLEQNLLPVVEAGPWMDDCIAWPPKSQRSLWHRPYRQLVAQLRQRRFDWAVLLPNSFRSALIARLAGARQRFGYARDGRGWLLTNPIQARNRIGNKYLPVPIVEYYADLVQALDCPRPGDDLELFTTDADERAVTERLQQAGVTETQPLVVISPGARYGTAKLWLPERFAAVADRLAAERDAAIVITCGPGEEAIARQIGDAMQRDAMVLDEPRLTLGQLKALIQQSDLVLATDAGPRHIAKAFDVPVVTIFGPTDPEWTRTNYPQERSIRVDLDCSPCQQRTCPLGHLRCMTDVTTDMVHAAAEELLDRHTTAPATLAT